MAKKQSSRKRPSKPRPKPRLKPVTGKAEAEKVRIGPLDPPPPETGGGTSAPDDSRQT